MMSLDDDKRISSSVVNMKGMYGVSEGSQRSPLGHMVVQFGLPYEKLIREMGKAKSDSIDLTPEIIAAYPRPNDENTRKTLESIQDVSPSLTFRSVVQALSLLVITLTHRNLMNFAKTLSLI